MMMNETMTKKVVIYRDAQKRAIRKMQEKFFGSFENYLSWRDSGKDFPEVYKNFKKFIGKCTDECYNDEFFDSFIALCPIGIIEMTNSNTQVSEDGDGTRLESVPVGVEADFAKLVTVGTKGKRARGSAKDPTDVRTYIHNVDNVQWKARISNYNESFVRLVAERYTENYNSKFGTDFSVHYSKKRIKKEEE